MKMTLYLCDLPRIHKVSLIMRKTPNKFQCWSMLQNSSVLPPKYQYHQNQGNLDKCPSQEEPKETEQLNVMWYPEKDPGTEKRN